MKTLTGFSFLVLYCEGGPQKGEEFGKNTSMPAETECALHVLSLPPSPCPSSQPPPWKVIKDKFCILGFWLWVPWWEQKDLLNAQAVLHQRKISTWTSPTLSSIVQSLSFSVGSWLFAQTHILLAFKGWETRPCVRVWSPQALWKKDLSLPLTLIKCHHNYPAAGNSSSFFFFVRAKFRSCCQMHVCFALLGLLLAEVCG